MMELILRKSCEIPQSFRISKPLYPFPPADAQRPRAAELCVSLTGLTMFRKELPRVHELRDLIEDPSAPCAYFRDFDNSIRDEPLEKETWLAREHELQGLDVDSWEFLKNEASPYLTRKNPNGRGWQQLITILNQARAYNFLKGIGCSRVQFIPRATLKRVETPDLQGEPDCLKVLCEVKTINASEGEVSARRNGTVRTITNELEPGFFNKLMSEASGLKKAKRQMETYDGGTNVRRIAYVVINFDDLLAEYKECYYQQIDRYLTENPLPGTEIVFHNQKTCFHKPITMTSALIFNE